MSKIPEGKNIKKSIKISGIIIGAIFILLLSITLLFRSHKVQNKLIGFVTTKISEQTHTHISINNVRIAWFKKLVLNEVYFSDQMQDTLFYMDALEAKIDSFQFFKRKVHISKIELESPDIRISKLDSTGYNFSFLMNLSSSDTIQTQSEWSLSCDALVLKNGSFQFVDSTMAKPFVFQLNELKTTVSQFGLKNNNEVYLSLDEFGFSSDKYPDLLALKSQFSWRDSMLVLHDFSAQTDYSSVDFQNVELNLKEYLVSRKLNDLSYSCNLDKMKLGLKDFVFLLGDEYDLDLSANVSGEFQGDMIDLRGRKFSMSVENFTNLSGDFYINGIDQLNSAYLFFNLNESFANLNEIRNLDLPDSVQRMINDLPVVLNNFGTISYKGNFTGFIDDFVAYGTAYSDLGSISSDVSFKPEKGEELSVNGHISAQNLDIKSIFNNDRLDKISLNGEINGTLEYESGLYDLKYNGYINDFGFNGYNYDEIDLNGVISNEQFNGKFEINDPNIKMKFEGMMDMMSEIPVFQFSAAIENANIETIQLVGDKAAAVSLNVDANFQGSNIDNVQGKLLLSSVSYENAKNSFVLDSVFFENSPVDEGNLFTLKSDVLDGELRGNYNFMNIAQSIITFYQNYLPASYYKTKYEFSDKNDLAFVFKVKDINPVIQVLEPELVIEPGFEIKGAYQPTENEISFDSHIRYLRYGKREIENISIHVHSDSNILATQAKLEEVSLGNNLHMQNVLVDANAGSDSLWFGLDWDNESKLLNRGDINILTSFKKTETEYPEITMQFQPSSIYLNDSLWSFNKASIEIDSTNIQVNNLIFRQNQKYVMLDGAISEVNNYDINAKIKDIDFNMFETFMGNSNFDGKINGDITIQDFYNKMMLNLDLAINNFTFQEGYLGEFYLKSDWNGDTDKLESNLKLTKGRQELLKAEGEIDPLNRSLDINLKLDDTPLSILQIFMPSTFNNQGGYADGDVHLHGNFKHIMHDGIITPQGPAQLGLSYMNTTYTFNDPIYFSGDSMIFRNITCYDKDGNTALFDGVLSHHTFSKMKYDMQFSSSRILVLNTNSTHNDAFYGVAYINGTAEITGEGSNIFINGNARSERGTNIYIPFEGEENVKQYDFIEFVNNKKEESEELIYDVVTTGLEMNFDLELTPDAKVQLIFNSQIGDIIKGSGNGDLQVKIDRNYNIDIYGIYEIEEGDYLFTLQNVINKRFAIDKGGTIQWVGNPYSAMLDIDAVYKVKTSLYDLFVGTNQDIDLTRRIPVDCKIHLTESLLNPKIDFTIDLPTVEERIKDEVNQVIVTQEEINRQIISLLMLGQFYTPDVFVGKQSTTTGAQLVGTTASELLSNQLSNWLSQISDVVDVGFNWRPGNEISDDQVELALSTQILNDRVTINSNIANNTNQNTNNDGRFISDFDVNVKLTENGRLQFKAYNHANDNIIYDTAPYTQGIGLSYREEFNNFKELLNRYIDAIFRKKKKGIELTENK